jgi:hypothetical protein
LIGLILLGGARPSRSPCPPKEKVTRSNRVGCANFFF